VRQIYFVGSARRPEQQLRRTSRAVHVLERNISRHGRANLASNPQDLLMIPPESAGVSIEAAPVERWSGGKSNHRFFTASAVWRLDLKKPSFIRCEGFLYFSAPSQEPGLIIRTAPQVLDKA
jgi:hypothetical protein